VTRALKTVEGVKTVKVHFAEAKADVLMARSACIKSSFDAMTAALKKAGYGGRVLKVSKAK